ncbi:hypothetical protein VTJ49DRAFT_3768 [Mycothermus thermophilus]|uniref:LisH domain-containing protein n=1 Tax=Humicola insolens TaxID=85995 RepID=A0ABR3V6Q4_HUMIN
MNNMAGMPNMNAMGGPVGPPMNMMNNGALGPQPGPPQQQQQNPMPLNDSTRTLLNTYIYEYFIRYGMYNAARAVLEADPHIKVDKDAKIGENGNLMGNGLGDAMDTDSKDDQKRPNDLPAPNVPTPVPDSCFLYEWFCLFWDMFNSQKGKGSNPQVNQYVHHTQMRQQTQREMLRQIRPDQFQQQQFQPQMMRTMPNGAMHMSMKPGNQLQRAAMANSQNPQAMQMLQQQKAAQMAQQQNPADMDGNRPRPGSPAGAENAPSPSKRPRLDGATPFQGGQGGVMMPNGRPGQAMPGQQQFQTTGPAGVPPHVQAKLASYSADMSQHHGNQIPKQPMPNAGGPQGQGSPMVPQGPDGSSLTQYYNPGDMPGNLGRGAPNGQTNTGSNHALQDYQMQLMLLEQQNKKRLMMARQEQDQGANNMPRGDGPAGPGGPAMPGAAPGGPNAQAFQGTSPPGARSGASPNPTEQMKRASQQMANAANMGSPLPDGAAQNRGSPGAVNFMGGNMDPNGAPPHFGMNMMGAQMNNMRPPSSHPPFNGQMNQQQMLAAQRQGQPGGQVAPMQWAQGAPNGGQMPGQPPQPQQVQGGAPTPTQRAMPPPSAPGPAAAAAANARTTASPQVSNTAPPTPQQANKAAPKKKETKASKKAAAAAAAAQQQQQQQQQQQKKTTPGLNAGATPAPEQSEAPQEGQTPATPVNPAGFPKNQNVNPGQVPPNGQQPPPPAPQPQAAPVPQPSQPSHPDPNQATNFLDTGGMGFDFEFANPMNGTDNVISDFDFDSFLNDNTTGEDNNFGFDSGFTMEGETTIGATD